MTLSLGPTRSRFTSHPRNCQHSRFSPQKYDGMTTQYSRRSKRRAGREVPVSRNTESSKSITTIPTSIKLPSQYTRERSFPSSLEALSEHEARLHNLRSRLGDTLHIPEVRNAIDILGEMAGPDLECDIIDEFIICPDSLFDQIAGMRSFQDMKDINPDGWPRTEAEEEQDTLLEGYYMSGALPTDTNSDAIKRAGRLVGVGSDDLRETEDFVRDKAE